MNAKVCTKGIIALYFNMPAAVIHQLKNQIHALYIFFFTLLLGGGPEVAVVTMPLAGFYISVVGAAF